MWVTELSALIPLAQSRVQSFFPRRTNSPFSKINLSQLADRGHDRVETADIPDMKCVAEFLLETLHHLLHAPRGGSIILMGCEVDRVI